MKPKKKENWKEWTKMELGYGFDSGYATSFDSKDSNFDYEPDPFDGHNRNGDAGDDDHDSTGDEDCGGNSATGCGNDVLAHNP